MGLGYVPGLRASIVREAAPLPHQEGGFHLLPLHPFLLKSAQAQITQQSPGRLEAWGAFDEVLPVRRLGSLGREGAELWGDVKSNGCRPSSATIAMAVSGGPYQWQRLGDIVCGRSGDSIGRLFLLGPFQILLGLPASPLSIAGGITLCGSDADRGKAKYPRTFEPATSGRASRQR